MSALDVLVSILRPPANPVETPNRGGWEFVETEFGRQLPEDYKGFINVYGTGAIDSFLWVLNPFSRNPYLNFFAEGQARLTALKQLRFEVIPYPLDPDADGLIPWCISDNGDVLYWLPNGDPSSWTVVANESRGPRWREYDLSTVRFLMGLVKRELIVDIFPDDFPSEAPEFVRLRL